MGFEMGEVIAFTAGADMSEQPDPVRACSAKVRQEVRSHIDPCVSHLAAILENCEAMLALLDNPIDQFSASGAKADLESQRASIALGIRAARIALAQVQPD